MKPQISISIFLLTLFCVSTVFGQTQESDLINEFIRMQNIKFPPNIVGSESYTSLSATPLTVEQEKFRSIFNPILSKRGGIEVDTESQIFLITDSKDRIRFQKEYLKIIDRSNLTFEQIVSAEADEKSFQREVISLKNLELSISCGDGRENLSWQKTQGQILFSVIKNFLSKKGEIEVDSKVKTITVSDDLTRISVIKQIIELFDKQSIEE